MNASGRRTVHHGRNGCMDWVLRCANTVGPANDKEQQKTTWSGFKTPLLGQRYHYKLRLDGEGVGLCEGVVLP